MILLQFHYSLFRKQESSPSRHNRQKCLLPAKRNYLPSGPWESVETPKGQSMSKPFFRATNRQFSSSELIPGVLN